LAVDGDGAVQMLRQRYANSPPVDLRFRRKLQHDARRHDEESRRMGRKHAVARLVTMFGSDALKTLDWWSLSGDGNTLTYEERTTTVTSPKEPTCLCLSGGWLRPSLPRRQRSWQKIQEYPCDEGHSGRAPASGNAGIVAGLAFAVQRALGILPVAGGQYE
jgi:hypothetical protein